LIISLSTPAFPIRECYAASDYQPIRLRTKPDWLSIYNFCTGFLGGAVPLGSIKREYGSMDTGGKKSRAVICITLSLRLHYLIL